MLVSDFYDTGHGGVEGHVLGVSRALVSQGHSVKVVRTAQREVIHEYDPALDGIEYSVLPGAKRTSRALARWLNVGGRVGLGIEFVRRLVTGFRSRSLYGQLEPYLKGVDVVHQHNFLEATGVSRRIAKRGHRVVWTNHLGEFLYLRRLPGGRWISRSLTNHFAEATAPSEELADDGAISCPVRMIPNGVDIERFRPCETGELDQLRARLGWPLDQKVILVPRRWAPTKGVVFAAKAMNLDSWPADALVVFAGSGTAEYPGYRNEIQKLIESSGRPYELHDSVDQSVMAEMLRASDYCLIPSIKEATSLSALEAMASGSFVIAANVGGLPQLVIPGETGLLHAVGDPRSLTDALNLAIASPGNVRSVARQLVVDSYSWMSVAMQISRSYEES